MVDLLYERNLSKRTADLFFYTEESADYNDLYNEDEHHCHLRVVYDLHPCMKLINRCQLFLPPLKMYIMSTLLFDHKTLKC